MVANRPSHYARHRPIALSPRQRQVLELMSAGRTNAEIGDELGITLDGAKYHVSEVLTKLDVHSREAAVMRWRDYNSLGGRLSRAIYALAPMFSLKWLAPATAVACAGIAGLVYLAATSGGGNEAAGLPTVTALTPPASAAAAAAATAAPTTPPAVATETKETFVIGEVPREAVVYVPARLSAAKAPAIIYLTAPGMGPQPIRKRFGIGLDTEADRLGFVAVWPEGISAPPQGQTAALGRQCCYWNNGVTTWGTEQPPDEVAFFKAIIDRLVAKYPVDSDRISIAGFAGGAVMGYRLACELGDRIAGFADVSSEHWDNTGCLTARPASMLLMLGTAHPNVPFAGGPNPVRPEGVPVPAVSHVVDYWRSLNGCTGGPIITMLAPN